MMILELKPELVHQLRQLKPKELNPQIIELVTKNLPTLSFHKLLSNRPYFKDKDSLYRGSLRSDGIHMIRASRLSL
jgi:hypothetical protein